MVDISLFEYIFFSSVLFLVGLFGVFIKKQNIIGLLMSIELMLLAININMISIGICVNNIDNQIFSIFILTVAAAEAAIGLALTILFFRREKTLNVYTATKLHG